MPGDNDKKSEANTDDHELDADALEQVSGGAAYIKFDGVDGESRAKVKKVDSFTIKQSG